MNIAGLTARVQLAINDNFEPGTGLDTRAYGADDPPHYDWVKVPVWLWWITGGSLPS